MSVRLGILDLSSVHSSFYDLALVLVLDSG